MYFFVLLPDVCDLAAISLRWFLAHRVLPLQCPTLPGSLKGFGDRSHPIIGFAEHKDAASDRTPNIPQLRAADPTSGKSSEKGYVAGTLWGGYLDEQ